MAQDLKYLAAFSIPLTAFLGLYSGVGGYFLTPVYAFILVPLLERLLHVDASNLDAEERQNKALNPLFNWLLYLNTPIVYGLVLYALHLLATHRPVGFDYLGLSLTVGIVLGTNGINVAHELGHRREWYHRFMAKFLLLPCLYMHFYIEHNFGHHVHAATREDPATARINQSVYSFWLTSVIRQYFSAWQLQLQLLKLRDRPFLSVYNDMLFYILIQAGYLSLVYFVSGPAGFLFVLGAALAGILLLETVNYIEHYGLLRAKLPSGRYERVREMHSWNSNHIMGRIILYELTRHSDHHYKSSKKYQLLDYHDRSPQLPFGYPTSMILALCPPFWFRLMNPRIPKPMREAGT